MKTIDELKNKINGIEELKSFVGTRKEIYNLIAEKNPIAIIDYRQATIKINDSHYLVILKKKGNRFLINVIWETKNNIQYHNI